MNAWWPRRRRAFAIPFALSTPARLFRVTREEEIRAACVPGEDNPAIVPRHQRICLQPTLTRFPVADALLRARIQDQESVTATVEPCTNCGGTTPEKQQLPEKCDRVDGRVRLPVRLTLLPDILLPGPGPDARWPKDIPASSRPRCQTIHLCVRVREQSDLRPNHSDAPAHSNLVAVPEWRASERRESHSSAA